MGSFMVMGLIGLIVASLVNMFLHSTGLQFGISILAVVIFAGLTAWDTQAIKEMYFAGDGYETSRRSRSRRAAPLPRLHQHVPGAADADRTQAATADTQRARKYNQAPVRIARAGVFLFERFLRGSAMGSMGRLRVAAASVARLALAGGARGGRTQDRRRQGLRVPRACGQALRRHLGGPALVDAPKGGAPGGDTATGVMIDFTFEGDKNFAPKYATATVDLTQTSHSGQQIVTHKAFTNFIFGADGVEHKAV